MQKKYYRIPSITQQNTSISLGLHAPQVSGHSVSFKNPQLISWNQMRAPQNDLEPFNENLVDLDYHPSFQNDNLIENLVDDCLFSREISETYSPESRISSPWSVGSSQNIYVDLDAQSPLSDRYSSVADVARNETLWSSKDSQQTLYTSNYQLTNNLTDLTPPKSDSKFRVNDFFTSNIPDFEANSQNKSIGKTVKIQLLRKFEGKVNQKKKKSKNLSKSQPSTVSMLQEEDEEKRDKRRFRNRVAATKCRNKKKHYQIGLYEVINNSNKLFYL